MLTHVFLAAAGSLLLGPVALFLGRHWRLTITGRAATGWLALGLAWWAGLLWTRLLDLRTAGGLALAMISLLAVGIADIRRPLGPLPQLAAQALAGFSVTLIGGVAVPYVTNPFGGLLYLNQVQAFGVPLLGAAVSVLWIILLQNALNFLDGTDGLATSVSGIGFLTIAAVSVLPHVKEPAVALAALLAAGACAGLLFWNFPPARLYLGTPGAWFLGFLLAVLSIQGSSKIATLAVVGAIPLLDALAVVLGRLQRGASPFRGDTTHLHHRLVARGWSPRRVLLLYAGLSALLGVAAVALPTPLKIALIAAAGIGVITAALRPTVLARTNLPR